MKKLLVALILISPTKALISQAEVRFNSDASISVSGADHSECAKQMSDLISTLSKSNRYIETGIECDGEINSSNRCNAIINIKGSKL